ncbi:DUF4199 domain-containing protein [Chitinophaga solisilvae]|uniref:DUF4199 domain-containing protein n=1 Tax=Chitinophaga solisilvae TaxID=1233460 RepID=UPI00136C9331|nr:DUF4199 domain-containing protein [Chitinophaga solisilvae]
MTNKPHVAYGLITALVLILISITTFLLKINTESWVGWLSGIALVAGVVLSCIAFSKQAVGGTFGSIFANGFRTTAVITVISVIFTVLLVYIFPDMKEQALEAARKKMEQQHQSEEVIEQGLAMTRKIFLPLIIGTTLFGNVMMGVIGSLIGAAIGKKNLKSASDLPSDNL